MIVPKDVMDHYGIRCDSGVLDADVAIFLEHFEPPQTGNRLLAVGCHDEATANILAACGFDVTGIDLRESDPMLPPCNYHYVRHDFCAMPEGSLVEKSFDAFVSLSAIEHFGFGTYNEGGLVHRYYDVLAMHYAWRMLREGGKAYITVPFGHEFLEVVPHWRVYNETSVWNRLVQDFLVEGLVFFVSGEAQVNGRLRKIGELLTFAEAFTYSGSPPHITVLVIMKKVPVTRLAPDGR